MIGAIIGDIMGSQYEFRPIKTKNFPLFSKHCSYTDDSLMTIAVADALMQAQDRGTDFQTALIFEMRRIGRCYPQPMGGYGEQFRRWLTSPEPNPYNSYGNGAAMRVSPCGEAAASLQEALALAKASAEVTHSHPEGIRGAQAAAAALYLAKSGKNRDEIRQYIQSHFYPLNQSLDEIRPRYFFDESCQGTVPQAITAFLESDSFEDAARNAVSLGGDCDTLTSITCAIAWAFYRRSGMDDTMFLLSKRALASLPAELRSIVVRWEARHGSFVA